IFADQRGPELDDPAPDDATGVYLDIHSYSQLVLWPWGFTYDVPPNGTALQTLGRKFAYFNSYTPQQAVDLYYTDGTTDDFVYGDLGIAAYTFELGTSFAEPCYNFEETILPDNLPALIYAAKAARTPYLTPAGPDVVSPAASPSDVEPGAAIQLSATINDTRYFTGGSSSEPSQPIVAAEYYLDIPPWDAASSPVSYTMSAADGVFNSVSEVVTATLDTTSLDGGWHMVYFRGQDAAGSWGAVSAVFIYIWPPNKLYLPNIYR
ncbi:MAG: hypothetical protein JXB15_18090, partial [Anaerolineales bacterium]|nr:hypothetical protein [Anaerolineales bacterium]